MSDEQTVTIDGTEHKVADLSPEQVRLVNHVAYLNRKLEQLGMGLEQSQVSRNHFMDSLKESLTDDKSE